MKNDELHLRHDAAARVELGCPHFSGMFALGASIDLMMGSGINKIQKRALDTEHAPNKSTGGKGLEGFVTHR